MHKFGGCVLLLHIFCTIQDDSEKVIVTQSNIDNSFRYSCSTKGNEGDILSWYQIKGFDHILLRRTQYVSYRDTMELRLFKKLELSDNNSELYCAKQTRLPGGGLSKGELSEKSLIRFNYINNIQPPIKPNVTVTPNTDVLFDINETKTFLCNGTTPADEKKLTWYIQGSKTTSAEKQNVNILDYVNTLELQMDQTYHEKRLFCAQELPYYHLRDDGTFGEPMYREIARSEMILLQQKGGMSSTEHMISLNLLILLVAIAVVLLLAATVCFCCRRQRAPPAKENEEDNDTCAPDQVTYAVLDLQTSTTDCVSIPAKDAESPYAQIIGFCTQSHKIINK